MKLRRDKNKPEKPPITVRQAVEEQMARDGKQTKFTNKIYELMLERPDDIYQYNWLSECFDKAKGLTECEQCNEPGYFIFNNAMYCKEHGKT